MFQVTHEGNPRIQMDEKVEEHIPDKEFSFSTSKTQAPKTYVRKNKKPDPLLLTPKLEPHSTTDQELVKVKQDLCDENIVIKPEPI